MIKEVSQERKFLHEIASPMAIVKLTLERLVDSIEEKPPELTAADLSLWLNKALTHMRQLEALHAEHKARLYESEND